MVEAKQKEWQQQLYALNQEKQKALEIARFATKKLMETVQDFQNHQENEKDMHTQVISIMNKKWSGSDMNFSDHTFETCCDESSENSSNDTY